MRHGRTIKCRFEGGSGYPLDARLELPDAEPRAWAVFCHCFTCTKDTITTFRCSRELSRRGYAVLRFDFTGLGDSGGDFAHSDFSSNIADLGAAVDYLAEHHQPPELLLGHSLGGTACLEYAAHAETVRAVVTLASPSQPDHVLHHFGHALTLLEQGIPSSIEVAGLHYDIEPGFIEDVRRYRVQSLSALHKPVLVFSVNGDALVSENNAGELHSWISGPCDIIHLDNTDHLFSGKGVIERVAEQIDQWYMNQLANPD